MTHPLHAAGRPTSRFGRPGDREFQRGQFLNRAVSTRPCALRRGQDRPSLTFIVVTRGDMMSGFLRRIVSVSGGRIWTTCVLGGGIVAFASRDVAQQKGLQAAAGGFGRCRAAAEGGLYMADGRLLPGQLEQLPGVPPPPYRARGRLFVGHPRPSQILF